MVVWAAQAQWMLGQIYGNGQSGLLACLPCALNKLSPLCKALIQFQLISQLI